MNKKHIPDLVPRKRTALDGKTYWCVWDYNKNNWSTYTCFGKYNMKQECEWAIAYFSRKWGL